MYFQVTYNGEKLIMKILEQITNRIQISHLIRSLNQPKVCEVGVRHGDFLNIIAQGNISEAYGVDIWQNTGANGQNDNLYPQKELDRQYQATLDRFRHNDKIKIIREFSDKASELFDDEYFDFVYLDADHTYEGVKRDLNCWYSKVKTGGILSGHDYIDGELTVKLGHSVRFGVVDAVEEFKKENEIKESNFFTTQEQYATFFIVK